jgi:alkylated DNA repair dioxygenase AlkB
MERILENEEKTAFLEKGIFENEQLLESCINDVDSQLEERPTLMIFGKICHQNRNVGFFSDESIGYNYSKKLMPSKPLTASLLELLNLINVMFDTSYNGILVNKYNDGNDYIGAHSDSDVGLDKKGIAGVICVSYGEERNFRIRTKIDKQIVLNANASHCSILHMGGNFQEIYTHEIPIQKKLKNVRFSLTFRKHVS